MKKELGLAAIWTIIIVIAALAVGVVGGYYYFKSQEEKQEKTSTATPSTTTPSTTTPSTTTPSTTTTTPTTTSETADLKKFEAIDLAVPFTFSFPKEWNAVIDYGEDVLGGSAGPKGKTVFRIAIDKPPIAIVGRSGSYLFNIYEFNEKSRGEYEKYFSDQNFTSISIRGADKAVKSGETQGELTGKYYTIYIKKGSRIFGSTIHPYLYSGDYSKQLNALISSLEIK